MRLEQIETPALILDMNVFDENQDKIMKLVNDLGVALRPHYKSTKCIAIVHEQLKKGAKGITCAKVSEAQDLIEAGVEDVLIANQITEPEKIAKAASLAKCCKLGVAVDQSQNIKDLEAAAALQGSTIYVLIEYEVGMKRCGVQTKEELLALAKEIIACRHLVFEGIQAYAGHLSHETDPVKREEESNKVEARLWEAKNYLTANGVQVNEISGTSTGTIGNRKKGTPYTEIQAGSYVFMDVAYSKLNLEFKNSLFVLTTVISKGNHQTITDAGRKSASVDQENPVFFGYETAPVNCSEEHTKVNADYVDRPLGDKLKLIPGHCCTCMNQNREIYMVRDGKVIDKVPITSHGKSK